MQRRGAAIDALSHVARHRLLSASYLERLVSLASEETLGEYSRCKAIEAIGCLKDTSGETLKATCSPLVGGNSEVDWRVLEAFLRRNVFDSDVASLVSTLVKVETAKEPWFLSEDVKLSGWQGYIIGGPLS